ncbi:hypothetical protein PsYK624_155730 [Phanerochaete sordida]|uniref:Uncharacterized protein n=1 Tax=Phanerochaete sordida TaxID=48140 RepID=A0A9P3GTE2_9APHY|nr:hypothetical protein PsYK624_155730 [Phanerochaete sordida]
MSDAAIPVNAAFTNINITPRCANSSVTVWMTRDFPVPPSPYRIIRKNCSSSSSEGSAAGRAASDGISVTDGSSSPLFAVAPSRLSMRSTPDPSASLALPSLAPATTVLWLRSCTSLSS